MLLLGEQQLRSMTLKMLVRHVRSIESEREVSFKHHAEVLEAMTQEELVLRALEVQAEIARVRALAKSSTVK
jgi:hypothetical protein